MRSTLFLVCFALSVSSLVVCEENAKATTESPELIEWRERIARQLNITDWRNRIIENLPEWRERLVSNVNVTQQWLSKVVSDMHLKDIGNRVSENINTTELSQRISDLSQMIKDNTKGASEAVIKAASNAQGTLKQTGSWIANATKNLFD